MKFSVIIPSYNQPSYIEATLQSVSAVKTAAEKIGHQIEVLLFDSASPEPMPEILQKHKLLFDVLEIKKDEGQYDAINKGIKGCTGEYWTWLNTDDTFDVDGIVKVMQYLASHPTTDYCYGSIDYIDEQGKVFRSFPAYPINYHTLVTHTPGIFQQGSFFRTEFTKSIGLLKNYNCCFDYDYVLRCLKHKAVVKGFDFKVANFRQHTISKTGSLTPTFIREQLQISKDHGRKPWHFLSIFSRLRLLKHTLFPRT